MNRESAPRALKPDVAVRVAGQAGRWFAGSRARGTSARSRLISRASRLCSRLHQPLDRRPPSLFRSVGSHPVFSSRNHLALTASLTSRAAQSTRNPDIQPAGLRRRSQTAPKQGRAARAPGCRLTELRLAGTSVDTTSGSLTFLSVRRAARCSSAEAVRDVGAIGRVLQSAATAATTPRQPDTMPQGADGTMCPPPVNHELRSLSAPFRDPDTVVADTGRLEGNNSRIFRGNGGQAALGSPTSDGWLFDFPFNSAGSAETSLFFAANFAHDFFYDLGFDEAAGNFQQDLDGEDGAIAGLNPRASQRTCAPTAQPTINMFSGRQRVLAATPTGTHLIRATSADILIHEPTTAWPAPEHG